MTIVERPDPMEFRQFLLGGGSVQFVVEPSDVDPDAATLSMLPFSALLSGFQIPRDFTKSPSQGAFAEALDADTWPDIERLIARRGGTISYRLLFPGLFQATCLIAQGKVPDTGALKRGEGDVGHLSAAPHR
ncbi:hypothetical protein [Dyella flagellata]|uniref:Uncharacterized protein n=1 Tax=Dyella flagellata TaxID=1867833 RepID=A0ABQ5XDX7_9GAMM|nr:hypothetical protein [Dyella flagellata]GLQ89840.1 hypothetical protein GCM10007898_34150 [Dyella flagellata]